MTDCDALVSLSGERLVGVTRRCSDRVDRQAARSSRNALRACSSTRLSDGSTTGKRLYRAASPFVALLSARAVQGVATDYLPRTDPVPELRLFHEHTRSLSLSFIH